MCACLSHSYNLSNSQDLSITFHFVYVYCSTFNCSLYFVRCKIKKWAKTFKKKYGYFIGTVYKKDIFHLQSIILKNKKTTIYIILIIMTYDFSWAIVQVTKLIDCTFSQCMPNLYCTAMTIIHIYSEVFNFVLWLTIVTHYLCVPRFTVYILIQLYIFRMIINTLVLSKIFILLFTLKYL